MDIDISRGVLEFLLWKSVDDCVLRALIRDLPLPHDDSILQKSMLLRRLQSVIAGGSVSKRMLGLIEQIAELHYIDGVMVPESMKVAYCAVAVNCTLRVLESDGGDDSVKYVFAVKKIWKSRVCKADIVGLISEELRFWGKEIEKPVWDSSVCEELLLKSKQIDPLELVRVYVAEEWENMGPFLQMLVDLVRGHNGLMEVLGLSNPPHDVDVINTSNELSNPPHDVDVINTNNELSLQTFVIMEDQDLLHDAIKIVDTTVANMETEKEKVDAPNSHDDEGDRPRLRSSKRIAASPLKKCNTVNLVTRRKRKKWNNNEEDALRAGVNQYGKGNWKLILSTYKDIFEVRTEVDLKDKWRNMTRK